MIARRAALVALVIAAACTRSMNTKESPTMSSDTSAVPGSAPTAAPTLTLAASLAGTRLHLVLANQGTAELTVLSHVKAGARVDLDWYTVTVTVGGAARELRFLGPRDHAGRAQQTLAPGASVSHDVDLDWWARQRVNGGAPLPTGAGTLVAVYQVSGEPGVWNGRIESAPVAVRW
jgi:hypothetical protein